MNVGRGRGAGEAVATSVPASPWHPQTHLSPMSGWGPGASVPRPSPRGLWWRSCLGQFLCLLDVEGCAFPSSEL